MASLQDNGNHKPVRIRRGRVESVDLYEIKDSELDIFEKGSPADLQLNFAIFLLSIAFAAIVALLTVTFPDKMVQTGFVVVAVAGVLLGFYLLLAWYTNRAPLKHICERIRQRIKEPGELPPRVPTNPRTSSGEGPREPRG